MQDQPPRSVSEQNLTAWLGSHGPLSGAAALEIALPLAAAVSAAHLEGRYVGALALERVTVIAGGPGEPPRVRIEALAERDPAPPAGVSPFASPEQVRGADDDERSDQYSLAAIVWACVTGHPPFEAREKEDLAEAIVGGIATVAAVRPDAPPALARVIDRATSLDPMRRYTSVRALGDALAELAPPELAVRWRPSFDRPSLEPRSVKERRDASGPVERPRKVDTAPLVGPGSVLGGIALVVVVAVALVLWAALAGRG